jgi:hypothetical protein
LAIRKPLLQQSSGRIQSRNSRIEDNPPILLSFKLLDLHGNPKFSTEHCSGRYLIKLLERLRDLNQTPLKEFCRPSNALRSHPIRFSETSEKRGFTSLNEQLRDSEPWQFQISSNEHGRIHGILLAGTFYVVWIDPCHLLYSQSAWCNSHPRPLDSN